MVDFLNDPVDRRQDALELSERVVTASPLGHISAKAGMVGIYHTVIAFQRLVVELEDGQPFVASQKVVHKLGRPHSVLVDNHSLEATPDAVGGVAIVVADVLADKDDSVDVAAFEDADGGVHVAVEVEGTDFALSGELGQYLADRHDVRADESAVHHEIGNLVGLDEIGDDGQRTAVENGVGIFRDCVSDFDTKVLEHFYSVEADFRSRLGIEHYASKDSLVAQVACCNQVIDILVDVSYVCYLFSHAMNITNVARLVNRKAAIFLRLVELGCVYVIGCWLFWLVLRLLFGTAIDSGRLGSLLFFGCLGLFC